jgi:alkaline phosphatase D
MRLLSHAIQAIHSRSVLHQGIRTARGTVSAMAQWGHSVHVDVMSLQPARDYWYRFRAGDAVSTTGRTRTAPRVDAMAPRLRLALASCQHFEHGYFTAYRHMAREDLDLVVHVGDYIYESNVSQRRVRVREHGTEQPQTLDEYRTRYALYKSDPDLQAAHAAFPWIVTWDDHEVQNDYANDRSHDLAPREAFLARRAAAYQAYYEHMPLPAWARPQGPDMRLYSECSYGSLAKFFVLDTRQYRSPQVCAPEGRGGSTVVRVEECPDLNDPRLTMLGAQQETWLDERLARTQARWNVITQQTLMARADRRVGPGADYWTDGWDGYPRARERLLSSIVKRRVKNPLVVGGDVHMSAVADLKLDFDDTGSPAIATEFVCPSITSPGPSIKRIAATLQENPHIRYANGGLRGYTTLELTASRGTAHVRAIASATERDSPVRDLVTYAVEDGKPGAQRA